MFIECRWPQARTEQHTRCSIVTNQAAGVLVLAFGRPEAAGGSEAHQGEMGIVQDVWVVPGCAKGIRHPETT